MENVGSFVFDDTGRNARKKRSIRPRRRVDDSQSCLDYRDNSSLSSTPVSDSMSKPSSEENLSHAAATGGKESTNQSVSRASYDNLGDAETVSKMSNEVGRLGESNDAGISKLKKVKLKVGGVTHTLHTKTVSEASSFAGSSSTKSSLSSDGPPVHPKLIAQDNENTGRCTSKDKGSGLQGIPWKDFSKSGFTVKKHVISLGKMPGQSVSTRQSGALESSRKSKRVPKKRSLGEVFDDGEDNSDDEIRYLEKVRRLRLSSSHGTEFEDVDEVGSKKQQNASRLSYGDIYSNDVDLRYHNSSSLGKERRKSRSVKASEDADYFEDEDSFSDDEPEPKRKHSNELIDESGDFKREMAITTRQRALKSARSTSSPSGASLIEFPNGLPPAPPKKPKEKLSEVEQQLKKAEAAQRRRMQVEKAAREAEAEAIRKILGQDSSRKKQEDKMKKRQDELAQERAANNVLASNAVRWVIGPSGTTVTFPDEIGLPRILESKPCSLCSLPSVILLHVKTVLALLVQMHTSTETQSQSCHCAASVATRQYMRRCRLQLLV
nr:transcriptional regulator ATRX-like isoform X1 [Coffea arabica]XP_027114841.1 transcriptional regulator ATRX-like isoform X1 [Coffea arabica]